MGSDGSSAAGANQSTDKFLSATEDSVVIKIDSTVFNSKTALKVGDVITLQVETTPGTFSDLLKKSDGSAYTYKVTADDLADGNGAANAAYISVLKTDLTQGATNIIRANLVDAAGNQASASDSGSVTLTLASNTALDAGTGDLNLSAKATPSAETLALGISVARGAAVGVSVASVRRASGAVTRPDDHLVLTAGDTLVLSGLPEPLALAEAKLLGQG